MALPSFNLTAKNTPADKQMAMMRTYLSQLKDETETELYDIKWDNLSSNLRKRIEELESNVTGVAEGNEQNFQHVNSISANLITASQVRAEIASFNYVEAGIISASVILGLNGFVDNLWSNYIYSDVANLGYATVTSLNAAEARIRVIEGDYITASDITAAKIRAKIFGSQSANIDWINAANIKLTSGVVMYANGADRVFTPISMNGYVVLAYQPQ